MISQKQDGTKWYTFPCQCSFPIDDTLPEVHGHPAIIYHVEDAPLDCPITWDLISSGRTKGVFQLESSLGKSWAKRLRPGCPDRSQGIEELSALVALLRPGCLKSKDDRGINMPELFCRRKHGQEEITYPVAALEPILKATQGVMVYQEQAMEIAKRLAGFNLQEADTLRKAIGKKDTEAMSKTRKMFLEKAVPFGVISEEEAITLFDNIQKSQRYSFNRSHSIAYAISAYWTAHEKAHFPLYFFTSYLYYAKEKQKPLKEIRALINEAKLFEIEVKPPSFANLNSHFFNDGVEITFGFSDVKGIGEKKVEKMAAAVPPVEHQLGRSRMVWSWFEFLVYFSEHVDSIMVRRMIEVGALRNFKKDRIRLLAEYDAWHDLKPAEQEKIAALREPVVQKVKHDKVEKFLKINPGAEPLYDDYDGGEVPVVLDPARPANNLPDALAELLKRTFGNTIGTKAKPSHPKYAVADEDRRQEIDSIRRKLIDPPSPLVDKPWWIAKKEEEVLGLPITFTHVDSADKSKVNTTCKEIRDGKSMDLMVLAVEVQEYREIAVKNGKDRGKKMAFLTVADETGALDDVVAFPKIWEKYGHLLVREGTVVGLKGKRDQSRGSLIVDEVHEI